MSMLLYVPPRRAIYRESFPLVLEASSLAYAQAPSTPASQQENARPGAANLDALTDARIGIVKAAVQLTPEQAKYWPAVEEAIRNRAMGRKVRLAAAARPRDQGDGDLIDMVRHHADALAQRAAELKQLADAWQPLAAPLTPRAEAALALLRGKYSSLGPEGRRTSSYGGRG